MEGDFVGDERVGAREGVAEGDEDGFRVGVADGVPEGLFVGTELEGAFEGLPVG